MAEVDASENLILLEGVGLAETANLGEKPDNNMPKNKTRLKQQLTSNNHPE